MTAILVVMTYVINISHMIVIFAVFYQMGFILDENDFVRPGYIVVEKHNCCQNKLGLRS